MKYGRLFLLPMLLSGLSIEVYASNGLNAIGFGAQSMSLAGADVARVNDTYALNINPAGLDGITGKHVDIYNGAVFPLNIGHKDQFGNDLNIDNDVLVLGNIGYGQRLQGLPITIGVGIYGQGGAGVEYSNLQTAFGTQDRLKSIIRIGRLNLGMSYRLSDKTSLGIALTNTYADANQDIFPGTSVFSGDPSTSFFGYRLENLHGVTPGVKVGFKHQLQPNLILGMAYSNETKLKLEGGQLISNQTAIGNGNVVYRNAKITGFKFPQELNLGLYWQTQKRWNFSSELTWFDWSSALRGFTLSASNPNISASNQSPVPPVLEQTAITAWRDQLVVALASEYQYSPDTSIQMGYNYGRNPIPDERLSPTLNSFAQHHFTFGTRHLVSKTWTVHTAVEYIPTERIRYTNTDLPFGVNTEERGESLSIHVTASRSW